MTTTTTPACETCGAAPDPETGRTRHRATEPMPDEETLGYWVFDGVAEATDGCTVEPDGRCEHGHQSWLLRLGLI